LMGSKPIHLVKGTKKPCTTMGQGIHGGEYY
jgi:hypothetical protein